MDIFISKRLNIDKPENMDKIELIRGGNCYGDRKLIHHENNYSDKNI